MKNSVLLGALVFAISESKASDLRCTDDGNEHLWIKSLVVDEEAKIVTLNLKESPSPQQAHLVDTKERQSSEPVYAFNLPPEAGAEKVTNVFKLFKVGKSWRLIDAGLLEVNGVFTLRALGDSVVFSCTRNK